MKHMLALLKCSSLENIEAEKLIGEFLDAIMRWESNEILETLTRIHFIIG